MKRNLRNRTLLSAIVTVLTAGWLLANAGVDGQTFNPDFTDSETRDGTIMYRLASKVSGETIELTYQTQLYILADSPPEEPSTIIFTGGELFFENTGPNRTEYEFGMSYLTDDVLSYFALVAGPGSVHYDGAELNNIELIPAATDSFAVGFSNSWLRNQELSLIATAGTLTADNTIFEAAAPAIIADQSSQVDFSDCIFLNANNEAILLHNSSCSVSGSLFITNHIGVFTRDSSTLDLSSTLFQGNHIALQVDATYCTVEVHHSSFWGNWDFDIVNGSLNTVNAQQNYWSEGSCIGSGPVDASAPLPETPCEPQILSNEPIIIVPLPPLADGDEPLMWNSAGKFTDSGLPVDPTYRIYRSTDPYAVFLPENVIAMTQDTYWCDPNPPAGSGFYCVTYAINR